MLEKSTEMREHIVIDELISFAVKPIQGKQQRKPTEISKLSAAPNAEFSSKKKTKNSADGASDQLLTELLTSCCVTYGCMVNKKVKFHLD